MAGTALFRSVRIATASATPWMNGLTAATSTGLVVGALMAAGLALVGREILLHHATAGLIPRDWSTVHRIATTWLTHASGQHLINNVAGLGAVCFAMGALSTPRRVTEPPAREWADACLRSLGRVLGTVVVCAIAANLVIFAVHPAGYEIVGASSTILAVAGVGMVDLAATGHQRSEARWLLAAVVLAAVMGWVLTDAVLVLGEAAQLRSLAGDPVDRYGHLLGWAMGLILSMVHWRMSRTAWWSRRRMVMPVR